MMKKMNKILAVLLLGLIVFSPAAAFAAEGDIFTIISTKMISTIQDVRRIVYVVAGFGLIMFAVLAIFNKISFKHLAYIMISLSLLAVMMPFINYFSGANLQDSEYNYENFIAGGDASILGSNVEDQKDCVAAVCPPELPDLDDDIELPEDDLSTEDVDFDFGDDEDLGVDTIGWDKNGCRIVNGEQQCCEGTISQKGKCQKSLKQVKNDIVKTTQNIVAGAASVVGAVGAGINVVNAVKEGAANVDDIISGDGNLFDKLGGLAGTIGSTVGAVTGNTTAAMGGLGSALDYAGAAGDVIKGDDSVSSAIDGSGVGDVLDAVGDGASDIGNDVRDVTGAAEDVAGAGNQAIGMGKQLNNWFGN